ncbi:MAG: HAD family phosphatase [Solirubrobacterales bacterium]|nr:HAD family phosphatase [Solirubrobacterales bacterium]
MAYPEAVLFDNDGLLLDSEAVWSRAEQKLFALRGMEFTIDHKRSLVGSSAEIAGRKLARFLEEPGREVEIMDELNELVLAELEGGVDAMVGARELVELLRLAGVPIALVSNSPRRFIERSHEVAGTGLPFDAVISGHEVPEAKPAPDAYLEGCRQLGVDPGRRVVALEDSPSGVTAAVAAGLFVIGIPSVPGVELTQADLVAASLEDEAVLHALGIEAR